MENKSCSRKILKKMIRKKVYAANTFLEKYKNNILVVKYKEKGARIEFKNIKQVIGYFNSFNLINANNFYTREQQMEVINEHNILLLTEAFLRDVKIKLLSDSYEEIIKYIKLRKNQAHYPEIYNKIFFKKEEIEKIAQNLPQITNVNSIREYMSLYSGDIAKKIPKHKIGIYIYSLYILMKKDQERLFKLFPNGKINKKSLKLKYTRSDNYDLDSEKDVFLSSIVDIMEFAKINNFLYRELNFNFSLSIYEFNDITSLIEVYEISKVLSEQKKHVHNLVIEEKVPEDSIKSFENFMLKEKGKIFNLNRRSKYFKEEFYNINSLNFKLLFTENYYNPLINKVNGIWKVYELLMDRCIREVKESLKIGHFKQTNNHHNYKEIMTALQIIELLESDEPYMHLNDLNPKSMSEDHDNYYVTFYKEMYNAIK